MHDDGCFCVNLTGPDLPNTCTLFYTYLNFVLYYASLSPSTGETLHFGQQCSVLQYSLNYNVGPLADFSRDVTQYINRTGYPENDEPTIILYPSPISIHVRVSSLLSMPDGTHTIIHTFQDLETSENVTCVATFVYDLFNSWVNFNFRDVYNSDTGTAAPSSFQDLVVFNFTRTWCMPISPLMGVAYHTHIALKSRKRNWCLITTSS